MKFKFDHKPICFYCIYAHKIAGIDMVMCDKSGAVPEDHSCKKFKYNIFARNPRRKEDLNTTKFSKEDFDF